VLRQSDYLVRWGGEEFLLVARQSQRRDAPTMAERIRQITQGPIRLDDGNLLEVSCTLGFACFPFDIEQPGALRWEQVVERADQALYVGKCGGRQAWVGTIAASEYTPWLDAWHEDVGWARLGPCYLLANLPTDILNQAAGEPDCAVHLGPLSPT
jgi:hypothetical protein